MASTTHENPDFRKFIRSVLERADLGEKYMDMFTDKTSMIEFTKAFTHKSIDPIDNYEFYEILGDSTTNKVVVWYFIRRYPEIFDEAKGKGGNMGPVAIMARLKMNGISKKTYSGFSDAMGFWNYIRRSDEEYKNKTKIMEDVFESFCGCLELLIDTRVTEHSGYGIVYKIMKTLMDPINVSLEREGLYDSKSRLNEEIIKRKLKIEYIAKVDRDLSDSDPTAFNRRFQVFARITNPYNGRKVDTMVFVGASKKIAETSAAKYVLDGSLYLKV